MSIAEIGNNKRRNLELKTARTPIWSEGEGGLGRIIGDQTM